MKSSETWEQHQIFTIPPPPQLVVVVSRYVVSDFFATP